MPSIAHDLSPELWILICIRARHASPLCIIAQACMSQLQNAKPRRRVRCVICPHNFDHCTRIGLQSHSAVCVCIRKVADICQRASRMQPARMEPAGFFRSIPLLPHQMLARLTPTADMIVLCHMGVPRLDPAQWSLSIDGLVERPTRLGFAELTAYPKHSVTSFHQCAGSPLQPFEPTRRICNVRWTGTRLADVLRDCAPMRNARYLWSWGADYGAFGGMEHPAYVKEPAARARARRCADRL